MRRVLFALALLPALSGCGSQQATLSGKVLHKGKPVVGGSLMFVRADGQLVDCPINPDGTFRAEGLPTGAVKFGVNSPDPRPAAPVAADEPARKKHLEIIGVTPSQGTVPAADPALAGWFALPDQYRDPDNSGLTVELKPGENAKDLELP